jgi:hypothetical protein
MKDLERFLMEEWSKIPPNMFSNLIKHFRKRPSVIILAKGRVLEYFDPYLQKHLKTTTF